jgi:hypothetical protein
MYIANTIDSDAFSHTQYRMYALFPSLLFAVVVPITKGMGTAKGVLIPNDGSHVGCSSYTYIRDTYLRVGVVHRSVQVQYLLFESLMSLVWHA